MFCRAPLPAVIFTMAISTSILIAGDLVGIATYGTAAAADIDRFKRTFFWWGITAVCTAAAAAGWRLFMRLEAIEGPGSDIAVPVLARERRAAGPSRRQHPLWLLVKKELHLQQMSFVLVILFVLLWVTLALTNRLTPDLTRYALVPFTALYCVVLSILIGALASAEERQFGTLEWQLLLPMAARTQWRVKAAMAVVLALLLGIAVPVVLTLLDPTAGDVLTARRLLDEMTGSVVMLTACSLYLSSISNSGVRAMVLSLPAIAGTFLYFQTVHWAVDRAIFRNWIHPRPEQVRTFFESVRSTQRLVMVVMALVFVAALLRYASINHRSAERSPDRLLKQAAGIAGLLIVWVLALAAVRIYYFSG
jgi:hypothetical protein